MQLRLKTKITLTTAALVLAVVGVNSTLYVMNLSRQVIRQAQDRAQLVSRQVFFQAQVALSDAAKAGEAPASDSPEDLRAYVKKAFDESASLASSIDAQMGYSPLIYEVSIADIDGTVLVSSDKVPQPAAVRYAWRNSPDCNLYNKEMLPAAPFRTDDWSPVGEMPAPIK